MNPTNILKQYLSQGLRPENILQKMHIQNPILNNVIGMAQKGDNQGVEKFARNICQQRGVDFDQEFKKFKNNFK